MLSIRGLNAPAEGADAGNSCNVRKVPREPQSTIPLPLSPGPRGIVILSEARGTRASEGPA